MIEGKTLTNWQVLCARTVSQFDRPRSTLASGGYGVRTTLARGLRRPTPAKIKIPAPSDQLPWNLFVVMVSITEMRTIVR